MFIRKDAYVLAFQVGTSEPRWFKQFNENTAIRVKRFAEGDITIYMPGAQGKNVVHGDWIVKETSGHLTVYSNHRLKAEFMPASIPESWVMNEYACDSVDNGESEMQRLLDNQRLSL